MVKYLLSFLFIFLMLSSFSFAKMDEDAKLKKEFGPDLVHVPFFLSYDFYKKYNKDWKDTYYFERKAFLKQYETALTADQNKEKAEAKAEAQKEKERLLERREAIKKERDRLRAQLAEEQATKKADAERIKDFLSVIGDQEKQISQMDQEIAEEKQNSKERR